MKSFLTAAAFGLLCASAPLTEAAAQLIPSAGLHGYLTEPVDFSEVDADIRLEGRSGWHVGADLRVGKKALYVQPGVHYYATRTEVVDLRDVGLPSQLGEQRHTAIKVPLQAGLRLGLNGTAAVHLQGGPVVTGVVGERLASDLGGHRDLTFGLMSGVAVDLLRFNAHVRYEWGQTQAFEAQPGKVDVLSVGVGLVF